VNKKLLAAISVGAGLAGLAVAGRRVGRLRLSRGRAAVQLVIRGGLRYAGSAPRLFAAAGEHRQQLRNDLALQTAEDVATTLGAMKGVLMKIGQMASYIDDGLSPAVRRTLSRLQDSVPPMSAELAAGVIRGELGLPPDEAFARWAPAQDVDALIAELRDRVLEELDYRREAENQRLVAAYYDGHPTISVPKIIDELSTRRVVTSELADGARFAELAQWSQHERDLAAETIYRFTFRSLYDLHAFNGDPHPGNYLFHGGGRVTFLDFGLVKHFSAEELRPLVDMVRYLCVEQDPEGFRAAMVDAGFLRPDAPVSTETVVEHMAVFYDTVRRPGPRTMTGDYASAVVRRFFDVRSPLAQWVSVPRSYVILQRINLGLFAILGELTATADWRGIAEEIWPFIQGPPTTPMGEAEAAWRAGRTRAAEPAA
jgi:predicted unusual protein kinase regulating ubiquinone biosynthesis (AarF/ABC1/UbiB family)